VIAKATERPQPFKAADFGRTGIVQAAADEPR